MAHAKKGVEKPDEAPAAGSEESPEIAELSFEASLERLEEVVDRLEEGELELEASLEAFEEGVRLSTRCSEQLASARRRHFAATWRNDTVGTWAIPTSLSV